jgi:hypothetical protein
MIKHWVLYDSITDAQIKQLYTAGACVNIDNDFIEVKSPINSKVYFVKNHSVRIKTVSEDQETLLYLMFCNRLYLQECKNDLSQYS